MSDNKESYREAARRLLACVGLSVAANASVETWANVHPMQDGSGAFVEVQLWVPINELLSHTEVL